MTRKPEVPKGPKLLLAEGKDEQYLLPELLELAGIPWSKPHPVQIHQTDGPLEHQINGVAKARLACNIHAISPYPAKHNPALATFLLSFDENSA